ncbi:MAG: tRNA modification GTPase [Fimbriiglobus sp.]
MHLEDTIVALATPPGPGGRAIVRLSGPNTRAALEPHWQGDFGPMVVGEVHFAEGLPSCPAMLLYRPGPKTYTGQDLAELHFISSPPIVESLLAGILSSGQVRAAERGEFTLRAFLAGKKDLTQAEAILAVIHAQSDQDLQQSLGQLAGNVSTPLQELRSDLLNLLADIEAGLDFVEEDIQFVSTSDVLLRLSRGMATLTNTLRQLETRSRSDQAFRIVLAGPPNAGKSSLFNAILGREYALVSPQAGTTRDVLRAKSTLGNVIVEWIDTAGLETATDDLIRQAQQLGSTERTFADLILHCTPATESTPTSHDFPADRTVSVRTKTDLVTDRIAGLNVSALSAESIASFRAELTEIVLTRTASPLAPSQARARGHMELALVALRRAHEHTRESDPHELLALALREALTEIGTLTGAIHTNDLLDRIFSRFCIGK